MIPRCYDRARVFADDGVQRCSFLRVLSEVRAFSAGGVHGKHRAARQEDRR